jgi:hypothetical protein
MRIVYPGLKYGEALAKANITTLHSRRELLSRKLFKDIVHDKNHKLAELLPPKSSHNKSLRNTRLFTTLQFVKQIGLKNHLLAVTACIHG